MKKNYDLLPINEQIKKLKQENITLIIIGSIINIGTLILSIYLLTQTDQIDLGIGLLICIPMSVGIGGVLPINENIKKIRKLSGYVKRTRNRR